MGKSGRLRAVDWRAVIQLTGECRDLGDDSRVWRRHLCEQLGSLVGASLVSGSEMATRGNELHLVDTVDWGWENGFHLQAAVSGLQGSGGNLLVNPHFAEYFRRPSPVRADAVTRRDAVSDPDWERSWYFRSVHEPCGFGHTILSSMPIRHASGVNSGLVVVRPAGDRKDFSFRQQALVRELHTAIAPLIGSALTRSEEPSPSALSRRLREVLRCLLEGDGDKQIASRLGISQSTVNGYIKNLFAHFRVSSRAELAARWVMRSWGRYPQEGTSNQHETFDESDPALPRPRW